ncbi:diacylglycerol/lipid kinase family protein [Mucilaginibacter sp. UC70_90]
MPELIKDTVDAGVMEPVIAFSDGIAHARVIAAEAVGKFDTVVAVGGDGTVNEVASAIVDTDTSLGIVPFGSGNGLSRFLGIPMDTKDAIKNLASGRTEIIDSARINGQPFFNMAGMGFDAHISEIFSHGKKRGFISYIKSSIKEVVGYQPQNYHLDIDGKKYDYKAFMLSIANSSQYGNNVHISPKASLQDGLLDVCVIKPFPLWRFPEMSMRMLIKATESSKYVEIIRGKQILIKREHTGPIHLDGEPQVAGTGIDINILPKSLKVIVGPSFKN